MTINLHLSYLATLNSYFVKKCKCICIDEYFFVSLHANFDWEITDKQKCPIFKIYAPHDSHTAHIRDDTERIR